MKILHLEASPGWGGQEIRILRESVAMKKRGHAVILAVQKGGGLISHAKAMGIKVYEIDFSRKKYLFTLFTLIKMIKKHGIDLINTHSSLDAWIGGIVGKLLQVKVLRTRHLSTPNKGGINSYLIYNKLTDYVVTTCQRIVPTIAKQSGKNLDKICSIPTGIDPDKMEYCKQKTEAFRAQLGIKPGDILVGMVCFMRSWKGIKDFLQAADLLKKEEKIKWVLIGGGHEKEYRDMAKKLQVNVTFTGHLQNPYSAINALDVFCLLSTAHEGVSQASLQAAFLKKPLITTDIGGLNEVCIDGKTGLIVPCFSPKSVASAVLDLKKDENRRIQMGQNAKKLIIEKFLFSKTIDDMEKIYQSI